MAEGQQPSRSLTDAKHNWGRWSADDELGALNLITRQKVLEASTVVSRGEVISLAHVIRRRMVHSRERAEPVLVLTVDGGDYAAGAEGDRGVYFADDFVAMPVATGTHIDALAHAWCDDGLFNGHDPNLVRSRGAKRCGIENVQGIVTVGVLADICALHGVDVLPPSHVISPDELEGATTGLGRPVGAGDALLVRTGWLSDENLAARDPADVEDKEPGLGLAAAEWIAERDIAVVGADNLAVEVLPPEDPALRAPLHISLITRLGVHLIELLDLERLARMRPDRFLFIAAPLRLRGAVNSPLNPIAVV